MARGVAFAFSCDDPCLRGGALEFAIVDRFSGALATNASTFEFARASSKRMRRQFAREIKPEVGDSGIVFQSSLFRIVC